MRKTRKLTPTYWFLCEGETENCYFSVWNNKYKKEKIPVKIKAIGQISGKNNSKVKKIFNKIDYNKNQLKKSGSKVFVLLDIDGHNRNSYSLSEINNIKKQIESKNIKICFSNKNFELWILLHLEYFNKENGNYIKKILKYNKKYKKGKNRCNAIFFDKVIKNLDKAIERAKKLEQKHKNLKHLKNKIPYTEVYKIFNQYLKKI